MNEKIKKHYERINKSYTGAITIAPSRIAKSLGRLYLYDRGLFFSSLARITIEQLPKVLLELDGDTFEIAIKRIHHAKIIESIQNIESDNATDIINKIELCDPALASKLLSALHPDMQKEHQKLSTYSEDLAGAYMQTEILTANPQDTLATVKRKIQSFREMEPLSAIVKLYITDETGVLLGSLHFTDLILFDDNDLIAYILDTVRPRPPITIRTKSPVEEVVRLFSDYDLNAIGVVNKQGILKGHITYDDVFDLIEDLHTEQSYSMAGVDDEAEEQNTFKAGRARLLWLFVNLGTILIASFVIGLFEKTIEQFVALAILMPVVAALGGNAGMQALTVTIRRLALGEIDYSSVKNVLIRELKIVILNGSAIAASIALISFLWFANPILSLIIAISMFSTLIVAGVLGGLIPLLLKKLSIDPAIASTVFLTTVVDSTGFFLFLGLAEIYLV
ncbi:MAG: magnesium transporter [Campylobacterota bacterium]|nr:magnesium transporter [Campylobacterota bacterium]